MSPTSAKGAITVKTWDATPCGEPSDEPKIVRAQVTETFSGDIQGEGVAEFLQVISLDGSVSFVGVERVTGMLGGRTGSFVLQDIGTTSDGLVSGTWFVVPDSGTGDLVGLHGNGSFSADLGKSATISLDYWFE
jgi:hypothetical protein